MPPQGAHTADTIADALNKANLRHAMVQSQITRALSKTTDPNDPELVRLDQELLAVCGEMDRLERMSAARFAAVQADAEATRRATRLAEAAQAVDLAKSRVPLAAEIDATLNKLGALLREWGTVGDQCRIHAAGAVRNLNSGRIEYDILEAAGGTNTRMAGALQAALFAIRLGEAGIPLEGGAVVLRPLVADPRHPPTLRDSAEAVAVGLEQSLARRLGGR